MAIGLTIVDFISRSVKSLYTNRVDLSSGQPFISFFPDTTARIVNRLALLLNSGFIVLTTPIMLSRLYYKEDL